MGGSIGWGLFGPKRKDGTGDIVRLVWQPHEDAIKVSYERLISEGWEADSLTYREIFYGVDTDS